MDGPQDFILSKVSQTGKDKYHIISPICGIYIWTYLQNRNRLTDIEHRLAVAKGAGGRGGEDREFGISKCQLLSKMANNRIMLFTIEHYIQYPVINCNGKECKQACVCVCVCVCVHIYMYIYDWITLLYSRNCNIVSQLYFIKIILTSSQWRRR